MRKLLKTNYILTLCLVLFLSGCDQSIHFTISPELHVKLETFLLSQPDLNSANFGGKVYIAYKVLETRKKGKDLYIDLWVLAKEIYYDTNTASYATGTASSIPVSIRVVTDGDYTPVSYQYPGDGSFYARDIKKIFSRKIRNKVLYQHYDLSELNLVIEAKAEKDRNIQH